MSKKKTNPVDVTANMTNAAKHKWNKLSPEEKQKFIDEGNKKIEESKRNRKERRLMKKATDTTNLDNDPNPRIVVHSVKPQKDGSALIDYEVNQAYIDAFLKDTGKKEFVPEELSAWIFDKIKDMVAEHINKDEKSN